MKAKLGLLLLLCAAIIMILILVCKIPIPSPAQKAEDIRIMQKMKADEVVSKITYIKDPRTGLVFAHYSGDTINGNDASLMLVPDGNIVPLNLLVVAKTEK